MIPDLWYAWWITVLNAIMNALPSWSFSITSNVNGTPTGPSSITSGVWYTVNTMRRYDMLIPLEELLVCAGFVFLWFAAMIGYYAVMWIIKRVTFSG